MRVFGRSLGHYFVPLGFCLSASMYCATATAEEVTYDLGVCPEQFERVVKTSVECSAQAWLTEEGLLALPESLRPLLAGLQCRSAIAFRKEDIYSQWIRDDFVDPPPIEVVCDIAVGGQPSSFSGVFDARCDRTRDRWTCLPGLQNVQNLGIFGTLLETYVNTDPRIADGMADLVSQLD